MSDNRHDNVKPIMSRDKLTQVPDAWNLAMSILDECLWVRSQDLALAMCEGTGIGPNAARRLIGAMLDEGIVNLSQRTINDSSCEVVRLNPEYQVQQEVDHHGGDAMSVTTSGSDTWCNCQAIPSIENYPGPWHEYIAALQAVEDAARIIMTAPLSRRRKE